MTLLGKIYYNTVSLKLIYHVGITLYVTSSFFPFSFKLNRVSVKITITIKTFFVSPHSNHTNSFFYLNVLFIVLLNKKILRLKQLNRKPLRAFVTHRLSSLMGLPGMTPSGLPRSQEISLPTKVQVPSFIYSTGPYSTIECSNDQNGLPEGFDSVESMIVPMINFYSLFWIG